MPDRHRFNVVVAQPPNFPHFQAYTDLAKMLAISLKKLGYPTRLVVNEFVRDATNIVVGAHNVESEMAGVLPADTIICNTEQIIEGSPFIESLLLFGRKFQVWDYSELNLKNWERLAGIKNVHPFKLGYLPEMEIPVQTGPRDIDVLFLGLVNRRRRLILDQLLSVGVRVLEVNNAYGNDRAAVIARSKLLLNIHVEHNSPFEMFRAMLAFAHRRGFISEQGGFSPSDQDLIDGMVVSPVENLASQCLEHLRHPDSWGELGDRGYEIFRRRDFTGTVRQLLKDSGF